MCAFFTYIVELNSDAYGTRGQSTLALNGDDGAAVSAFANLLVLVVRLDLEAKLAAIDLEQLGAHRHLLAFRRGPEVFYVHLEAHGGVPFGEMRLYGLDA